MKLLIGLSLLISNLALAQVPFDFERDLPLLLKASDALVNSNCQMRLVTHKENVFIQLISPKESDSSNFHSVISSMSEKVSAHRKTTTFTTTWYQDVLFSRTKFVTRFIVKEVGDTITHIEMKTRESGATVLYPVLRYSSVSCKIRE